MKKIKFDAIITQLEDGSPISINGDFAVGTQVFLINDDGTSSPAPDGELTLIDGTTFTVADGAISAIANGDDIQDGDSANEVDAKKAKPADNATGSTNTKITDDQPPVDQTLSLSDLTTNYNSLMQMVAELKADITNMQAAYKKLEDENSAFATNVEEKFKTVNVKSITEKAIEPAKEKKLTYAEEIAEKLKMFSNKSR